ncbi:MAG TPA: hypothetical protein VJ698_00390 [Noviherbaspirillum sp.]|nr:hypothetical protein [Noviherbaspirillum sp.]HJV83903.1 hypothetical protein [Noviherbaspirillum sp.]
MSFSGKAGTRGIVAGKQGSMRELVALRYPCAGEQERCPVQDTGGVG